MNSRYNLQYGHGIPSQDGLLFYRGGPYRQKGYGLGSFFGRLFSKVVPFARDVLFPAAKKYVLPQAMEMAKNVAKDVLTQKQSFRQSLRDHGAAALKSVGEKIGDQSGSGRRRVKVVKRKRSATNAQKRTHSVSKSSKHKPGNKIKRKKKKPRNGATIFD